MRILSIQSSVVYGHVGNTAATFPLQRLGHEVWAVPTVMFACHVGYGPPHGPVLSDRDVHDIIDALDDLGVLGRVDAVLSGYQGSAESCAAVLSALGMVRAHNPGARYCCDPVIGDWAEGVYVQPGVPDLVRDALVPAADVVTPNTFELSVLTGTVAAELATLDGLHRAIDRLHARGPHTVLVTSVRGQAVPDGRLGMIASAPSGGYLVDTPLLPVRAKGAGDVTSALFLAHLSDGADVALGRVASSMNAIMAATAAADADEMLLVASQQAIAEPPCEFEVRRIW